MFDVILQSGDFYLSKLYGKKVELPRKTVSTFPLKNFIHIFLIDYCLVIYNDKILSKPKRSVKRYILMTKVLQIQLITHSISPRKCIWTQFHFENQKKMKNKNSNWFYSLKTFSKSCSESDGSSLSIDEPDGCFTPDESNGFPVKSYKYVFLNEFPEMQ